MSWHDGDVVQTQQPYDDYPVTLVRMEGQWRPILSGIAAKHLELRTDAEIEEWTGEEEIAVVKIQQEHHFPMRGADQGWEPFGQCFLCGIDIKEVTE